MSSQFPTRQVARLTGHNGQIPALTYSCGLSQYILTGCTDRLIRLFNPGSGRLIQTYSAHGYEVLDIAVSEDNSRIVSGGGDKTVFLWDVSRAVTTRRWSGHVGRVESVAFAGTDDSVVVSGSYDSSVKIWDTKSQNYKPIMSLDDARDSVSTVRVQDCSIITGSVDGKIRTYDIRMGSMYQNVLGSPVTSLTPTKDAQSMLVSTLSSTLLLDQTTGVCLQSFKSPSFVHGTYRLRSALGLNDSVVVSGSENGNIWVWDILSGQELHQLRHDLAPAKAGDGGKKAIVKEKNKDVVSVVAVCRARKEWASAGGDGSVIVWGHDAS